MIPARTLTPELLDVAVRVARTYGDRPDARALLTVALGDHVSNQEASGKTGAALARVWLTPPEPARAMIGWALDHLDLDPGRQVLHLGALLATSPFYGHVAATIGRSFALGRQEDAGHVRRDACSRYGGSTTVAAGARAVYLTFHRLGLLDIVSVQPTVWALQQRRPPVPVPPCLGAWLAHALVLTRRATAVSFEPGIGLRYAPELAFAVAAPVDVRVDGYPYLEAHNEPCRRIVLEPRRHVR